MVKSRTKQQRIILCVVFVVWFIVNLISCITHEPFRDEAQSWLIAKENSIPGIISFIWEEGNSWLYHLFLFPFAHLGMPYEAMRFVSLALCAVAVWIFMFKSPFSVSVVSVLIWSPMISYYAPSFARPYAIAVLCAFGIAALWKNREKYAKWIYVLAALLGASHIAFIVFGFVVASRLFVLEGRQKRYCIPGIVAYLGFSLAFYLPLYPHVQTIADKFGLSTGIIVAGLCIAAVCILGGVVLWTKLGAKRTPAQTPGKFCVLGALGTIVTTALTIIVQAVLIEFSDGTAFFSPRHFAITFVVVITMAWIVAVEYAERFEVKIRRFANALISVDLGILIFALVFMLDIDCYRIPDITQYYSNAREVAETIESLDEDARIVATHPAHATAVVPYLSTHSISVLTSGNTLSYCHWSEDFITLTAEEWKERLEQEIEQYGTIYLLHSSDECVPGFNEWIDNPTDGFESTVILEPSNTLDRGEREWVIQLTISGD